MIGPPILVVEFFGEYIERSSIVEHHLGLLRYVTGVLTTVSWVFTTVCTTPIFLGYVLELHWFELNLEVRYCTPIFEMSSASIIIMRHPQKYTVQ